jgi:hypothetical protein
MIKEKFLQLTSRTYPHGTEEDIIPLLGINLNRDRFGNRFILIGEKPNTMFTSHLDTADSGNPKAVKHLIEDHFPLGPEGPKQVIKTDGNTILGADDKAGVVIMLYMIQNSVPGLYYFFLGEEVGCVGSHALANSDFPEKFSYIKKVVSFDRRGTTSVISHQGGKICASDNFTQAIADQLNKFDTSFKYETDPTGIWTDSAVFIKIFPECTNISVGYKYEHTKMEYQDMDHLEKLAEAVIRIDWASLPVFRNINNNRY